MRRYRIALAVNQILHEYNWYILKGPLLHLRQFPTTESSFKMIKNAFYFILKALFVLKIFTFFSRLFGHVGKFLDKKTKVDFKIYDVTDWAANHYNTHIVQHLEK